MQDRVENERTEAAAHVRKAEAASEAIQEQQLQTSQTLSSLQKEIGTRPAHEPKLEERLKKLRKQVLILFRLLLSWKTCSAEAPTCNHEPRHICFAQCCVLCQLQSAAITCDCITVCDNRVKYQRSDTPQHLLEKLGIHTKQGKSCCHRWRRSRSSGSSPAPPLRHRPHPRSSRLRQGRGVPPHMPLRLPWHPQHRQVCPILCKLVILGKYWRLGHIAKAQKPARCRHAEEGCASPR